MRVKRSNQPTERARRWAEKLTYADRERVREFLFRIFAANEELKLEKKKEEEKNEAVLPDTMELS